MYSEEKTDLIGMPGRGFAGMEGSDEEKINLQDSKTVFSADFIGLKLKIW